MQGRTLKFLFFAIFFLTGCTSLPTISLHVPSHEDRSGELRSALTIAFLQAGFTIDDAEAEYTISVHSLKTHRDAIDFGLAKDANNKLFPQLSPIGHRFFVSAEATLYGPNRTICIPIEGWVDGDVRNEQDAQECLVPTSIFETALSFSSGQFDNLEGSESVLLKKTYETLAEKIVHFVSWSLQEGEM